MNISLRWLLVLLMVPAALLPATGSGLVLCLDGGPDAHISIEWESCCAAGIPSPVTDGTDCSECSDIPLAPEGAEDPLRLRSSLEPAPATPPREVCAFAPAPRHPESPVLRPRARTAFVAPLSLRI